MAVTPMTLVRLVDPAFLAASDALVYTAPTGKTVRIEHIRFCNTTGSASTVSWAIVPVSGSIGASKHLMSGMAIAANGVVDDEPGQVLAPGDMIYASAGSATAVSITISGLTVG